MAKNNRTNFRALIENIKEKARLNREKRSIKPPADQGKDKPRSDKEKP
ncbi:MAG: hypothetical protein RL198_143 [Actinomycetota bacterium]